jgi:hypothetical protein
MEYRSFEYTNEFGQVELARGSWIGVAVSWVILQTLKIALLAVVVGLAFSVFKYCEPSMSFAAPAAYNTSAPLAAQAHTHG